MEVINYLLKLVILALPLFAIPALLKSSNSMLGRIYGTAQNLGGRFTGGMKEDANKRAKLAQMETAARRSVAGVNPDGTPGNNYASRRNRFSRWAGGRATRTDAQRQFREAEAKRLLEDDTMRNMGEASDSYVGVGADRGAPGRVAVAVNKMDLKRQIEDMEPAKLQLEAKDLKIKAAMLDYQSNPVYSGGGPARDQFLNDQFAQATTNEQRAALADLAMQNGASGRSMVSDFASSLAAGSEEAQSLAAHLGKEHYATLEASAPEVTDFINSAGADVPGAAGASSWKKVTAQNIGKLDVETDGSKPPKSLNVALSTPGAISDATLKDALSPLNRANLPQGHRDAVEREARNRGLIP